MRYVRKVRTDSRNEVERVVAENLSSDEPDTLGHDLGGSETLFRGAFQFFFCRKHLPSFLGSSARRLSCCCRKLSLPLVFHVPSKPSCHPLAFFCPQKFLSPFSPLWLLLLRSPDLFLSPWVSFSVFLSLSSPFPAHYFFLSFALKPLLKFSQSLRSFSLQPESSLILLGFSLAVSPPPSLAVTFSTFILEAPSRNLTSKAQKKLNSLALFLHPWIFIISGVF